VSEHLADVGAKAPTGRRAADENQEYAVSLAWTGLQPTATADAILDLNTATDWASFREAAAEFAVPAQNMVYADREGHIGYQAPA
jgi:penicillin amidase